MTTSQSYIIGIFILLLVVKACVQTYNSPDNERQHLRKESQVNEPYYSSSFVKFHELINFRKSKTSAQPGKFQQFMSPTVMYERNYSRRARGLAQYGANDNKIMDKRFIIQHIPFVIPIENLFKNVDYQFKKYIYDGQTRRKEQRKENKQRNQIRKVISKSTIRTPKTQFTEKPLRRLTRSTMITKKRLTTPRRIRTTLASKRKTPSRVVSNTAMPFTTRKTFDIYRNLTKKFETTTLTTLPETAKNNATAASNTSQIYSSLQIERIPFIHKKFARAIDKFERKYYNATYGKLSAISPADRRENGISFVESGFFLFLILSALSMEVDSKTRSEIDSCLELDMSDSDKIRTIQRILDLFPASSDVIKFRWATRLVVNNGWQPVHGAGEALRLHVEQFSNETTEQLTKQLNEMVEQDSGGAMRYTFEEDELAGASAVLIHTMYLRARWRAAPTLLNGTHPFRDADDAPPRTTRMLRINDVVRYADLTDLDAQAVEIAYATPGMSLLVLVPRGRSLRAFSQRAAAVSVGDIVARMQPLRAAVTLPIYTLRMTLLLPNKFQAMGISRLVAPSKDARDLRLSHAVQRLMFWAEAGRNAFKDDGIEWDQKPDLEIMVDRPYLFYVRWRHVTLMNGNFVL